MGDPCPHDSDPATCDACYAEDAHDAARPVVPLGVALAELEATNPAVAATVGECRRLRALGDQRARRRGRMGP